MTYFVSGAIGHDWTSGQVAPRMKGIEMFNRSGAISAIFAALFLTSACTGDMQVTRTATFQETGQIRALTRLARQFMAETPYIVHFEFDSWDLDDTARASLDQQAAWIRKHPEARFSVYGHTDLMGSTAYNAELGLKRAQAVIDYLTSKGIRASRLDVMKSVGEGSPVLQVVAPAEINRRAVTFVDGLIEREPRAKSAQSASRGSNSTGNTGAPGGDGGGTGEESPDDEGNGGGEGEQNGGQQNGGEPEDEEGEPEGDGGRNEEEGGPPEGDSRGTNPEEEGSDDGEVEDRCNDPGACRRPDGPRRAPEIPEHEEERPERCDSGRGNGDDGCDPGKSESKNQGGDN